MRTSAIAVSGLRIAVLDQGHLVAEGTPDELKRRAPGSHVRLRFPGAVALDAAARVMHGSAVDRHYVEYATPGLILLAITYGLSATAVSANSDMTKGIINRFKFMNVSRGAVLNGHVVATMLSSSVAIAVIIGMAFALGFRSPATVGDWLGAIGIAAAAAFAAAWLTVALGIAAKTPESAGLTVVPLLLLPFVSSAIVPAACGRSPHSRQHHGLKGSGLVTWGFTWSRGVGVRCDLIMDGAPGEPW
jgi:hypothetical protein